MSLKGLTLLCNAVSNLILFSRKKQRESVNIVRKYAMQLLTYSYCGRKATYVEERRSPIQTFLDDDWNSLKLVATSGIGLCRHLHMFNCTLDIWVPGLLLSSFGLFFTTVLALHKVMRITSRKVNISKSHTAKYLSWMHLPRPDRRPDAPVTWWATRSLPGDQIAPGWPDLIGVAPFGQISGAS